MGKEPENKERLITAETVAEGLQASSEVSQRLNYPGPGVRPCVARIVQMSLAKGDFPNRHEAGVIIASELYNLGLNYDEARDFVEEWNSGNRSPMRFNEIQNIVNMAYSHKYNYGCFNAVLLDFCIGRENCPFWNRVAVPKSTGWSELPFIDNRWPNILSSVQLRIYAVALPYLEKRRRVRRGGIIYANHFQIAEACGVSRERVGQGLRDLAAAGLIEYRAGEPRIWQAKASEIRRIFPIPKPERSAIARLRENERNAKGNRKARQIQTGGV